MISDAGGTPEPITTVDAASGETTHRWATFLPDGEHFLYMAGVHEVERKDERNAIYVDSLGSSERKLVLRTGSNAAFASGYLLYVQGSALLAQRFDLHTLELEEERVVLADPVDFSSWLWRGVFSVSRGGRLVYHTGASSVQRRLVWVDREGKEIATLPHQSWYEEAVLSPDNGRIAVVVRDPIGTSDIWIYEIERDLMTRLTFGKGSEDDPVWSPDGSRIAFVENSEGQFGIWIKNWVNGEEERLLSSDLTVQLTGWSPDGGQLGYTLYEKDDQGAVNDLDIWMLPLDEGREPFPLLATDANEALPTFSLDGKWIAYTSEQSKGQWQLYVAPFPGLGRKWQISTSGSSGAVWGDDELYWWGSPGATMMATAWSVRDEEFLPGASKPLFRVSDTVWGDVTRDGQRSLLVKSQTDRETPLTVVTNWERSLRN